MKTKDPLDFLKSLTEDDIKRALAKRAAEMREEDKKERFKPIMGGLLPSCNCPCHQKYK